MKEIADEPFKSKSLELFEKEVIVTFQKNTSLIEIYGERIQGKFIGRTWGEKSNDNSNENLSTVISIKIRTAKDEIEIPCSQIKELEKVK